ncbi:MAG: hypothetical protein JW810_02480 [Sedimentisphaerales bacterium]|nr:hypothetical protein [Sedimentisphaerales bacterium]
METNPLTILQLQLPLSDTSLEKAYRDSRLRVERLTARGPLRYYRRDLLADVRKAYRQLKGETRDTGIGPRDAAEKAAPRRVVSRCAAEGGRMTPRPTRAPLPSDGLPAADLSGLQPMPLRHRQIPTWKTAGRRTTADETPAVEASSGSEQRARQRRAQIEDEFCREVIYRLEGDLIRYSSRLELLHIAADRAIAPFRANLLIAQIVEAVRQQKRIIGTASTPPSGIAPGRPDRRRHPWARRLAAVTALLVLLADLLLLRWLMK